MVVWMWPILLFFAILVTHLGIDHYFRMKLRIATAAGNHWGLWGYSKSHGPCKSPKCKNFSDSTFLKKSFFKKNIVKHKRLLIGAWKALRGPWKCWNGIHTIKFECRGLFLVYFPDGQFPDQINTSSTSYYGLSLYLWVNQSFINNSIRQATRFEMFLLKFRVFWRIFTPELHQPSYFCRR